MIRTFEQLRQSGGFADWNRFHDCFLCEYAALDCNMIMVLERLYDWDAKKNTQTRVVLSIAIPAGQRIHMEGASIIAFVGEMVLDYESTTINAYFGDAFLRVPVDISQSYLVELKCEHIN